MTKTFEYCYVTEATGDVTVENIGNCYLEAYNSFGNVRVLWIRTISGISEILETDWIHETPPISLDGKLVSAMVKYSTAAFTERKIIKIIENFINKPYCETLQVIDKQDIYSNEEKFDKFYNIINYMKSES